MEPTIGKIKKMTEKRQPRMKKKKIGKKRRRLLKEKLPPNQIEPKPPDPKIEKINHQERNSIRLTFKKRPPDKLIATHTKWITTHRLTTTEKKLRKAA